MNNINLSFRRGEFVAITSESGSGKVIDLRCQISKIRLALLAIILPLVRLMRLPPAQLAAKYDM